MKLLVVAYSRSLHVMRWLSTIADEKWEVHLWDPCYEGRLISKFHYPGLAKIRIHLFNGRGGDEARVRSLASLIRKLQPHVVHSIPIQTFGELTLAAKRSLPVRDFPPWIITDWNDLSFLGNNRDFLPAIRQAVKAADFYWSECDRNYRLAKSAGFRGEMLPLVPGGGGYDLEQCLRLRAPGASSERRWILLKGYQNQQGRALVGLRALERCAPLLKGYRIGIYGADGFPPSPEIPYAAELFTARTGLKLTFLPATDFYSHLRRFGKARIAIGLCSFDGLPGAALDAMVMGAYPIQSDTACFCEWIDKRGNGSIVSAEDPAETEEALRAALKSDSRVDRAAKANLEIARARLDHRKLRTQVIQAYRRVASS